jgi:hypothetical protein
MDRFITSKGIKETGDFLGNQSIYDIVQKIVETNETICLYGDSGVGKTHLVTAVMKGRIWVDLTFDCIKNAEFRDRLKSSECHVVLDDLESDVHLVKDIFEIVKGGGKISKGALIIIARNISKVNFCNCVHFDHIDHPTMVTIGRLNFPKEPLRKLELLATASHGNVRNFLFSIGFEDTRDIFRTPKDFIADLLCSDSNVNPLDYLGKSIPEHGYTWDVVHENYPDSKHIPLVTMSECMSLADILDSEIYKGNWDFIPLFSMISTIIPARHINHTLDRGALRAGSAWTKFGNYKMRHSKYSSMSNRCGYTMDIDSLMLLKTYCQQDTKKAFEICKTYKLESPDMDIMNHLALIHKLKAKDLQAIKKSLKASAS